MITVVLVKPQNSANLGFIARSMANFDLKKLQIIKPLCSIDDEEARKTGMHAQEILDNAQIKEYTYINNLKKDFDIVIGTTAALGTDYNIQRTPLTIEEFSQKLKSESYTKQNIAILFGNEGQGLSNEEADKCDFLVTIPCSKKYQALNISHAAAIIFYEIYKITGKNKLNSHITPISRKEKELIEKLMNNVLESTEFQSDDKRNTQKLVWKRVFEKAMLSKRESFVVMGLLRKLVEIK